MKFTRRFIYVNLKFKSGYKENYLALTSLKIPLNVYYPQVQRNCQHESQDHLFLFNRVKKYPVLLAIFQGFFFFNIHLTSRHRDSPKTELKSVCSTVYNIELTNITVSLFLSKHSRAHCYYTSLIFVT